MHAYKRNRHEPGNDSSAPPIRGPADGFGTDCDPQGHSFGWGFAGTWPGNANPKHRENYNRYRSGLGTPGVSGAGSEASGTRHSSVMGSAG